MNCSPTASDSEAIPADKPVATARPASAVFLRLMVCSLNRVGRASPPCPSHCLHHSTANRCRPTRWCAAASIWKRPAAQLLLSDLPQPGEPVRLDDQEEDDQSAEDHELDMGDQVCRHVDAEQRRRIVQENRQQHDEGGAEERTEDAAEAADDDHEQDLERAVD